MCAQTNPDTHVNKKNIMKQFLMILTEKPPEKKNTEKHIQMHASL